MGLDFSPSPLLEHSQVLVSCSKLGGGGVSCMMREHRGSHTESLPVSPGSWLSASSWHEDQVPSAQDSLLWTLDARWLGSWERRKTHRAPFQALPPTPIHDPRCQSSYKQPSNPSTPRPGLRGDGAVTKVGEVPAPVELPFGVEEAGEAAGRYTCAWRKSSQRAECGHSKAA